MKVLITTEFYLPLRCGVTTAVINLRKALEERGHEVRILTITGEKESRYEDNTYYIKSNLPQLYKDSYSSLALSDDLMDDIYSWKPDVVHSQCEFFTMAFAKRIAKRCNTPLIHTCHTDFDSYGINFMKDQKLWKKITKTFVPSFMKAANVIVCPTDKIQDLLTYYKTPEPMTIIPVGLDLKHLFSELSIAERNQLRNKYNINNDDTVLVSVCRLSPEKNVLESIEHFISIKNDYPNLKLLIVGGGTEETKLKSIVMENNVEDRIKFTGDIPMEDVWKYYKCGDIFISSSLSEIQGLTYIEALSSGLPIICRKDNALNISLIEGYNGFEFSDNEEFKQKVKPLILDADYRKEIGKNAVISVDKFSLEHFGEDIESLYTIALDESWLIGEDIPCDSQFYKRFKATKYHRQER